MFLANGEISYIHIVSCICIIAYRLFFFSFLSIQCHFNSLFVKIMPAKISYFKFEILLVVYSCLMYLANKEISYINFVSFLCFIAYRLFFDSL